MNAGLVRTGALLVPLSAVAAAWILRKPARRTATGALVATAWTAAPLALVGLGAERFGWWSFSVAGPSFAGVPLELYLGWMLLWGALPVLVFPPRTPATLVVGAFGVLDLIAMPPLEPVVDLGPRWFIADAAAIVVCVAPAFLLGRWTIERRHALRRGLGQAAAAGGLMLIVVPQAAFETFGGGWGRLAHPSPVAGAGLALLGVPFLVGLAAVVEFASRGDGTPLPFDPPRRLVASGPYAYVRNPMQLSLSVLVAGLGLAAGQPWLVATAAVGVAYSEGLARWHEDLELTERYGTAWTAYRASVRRWLPSWRPHPGPATVYIARSCVTCDPVRVWLEERRPVALEFEAAERRPSLTRMAYVPADGSPESYGIAAFARALDHLHLGWAVCGWALRLPGVVHVAQLIGDAVGFGPKQLVLEP